MNTTNDKHRKQTSAWELEQINKSSQSFDELSDLDNFLVKRTTDMYMTNTKLAHTFVKQPLQELASFDTNFDVEVGGGVVVTASIEIDEALEILGKYEFDDYDKTIHDAICTIGEAGNVFFTVDMIYRTMYNYTTDRKPSNKAKELIKKSIHKMQNITLKADFSAHLNQKNTELENKQMIVKDRLLSLREYQGKINGATVEGYRFNGTPILYDYSKAVKQLITVPAHLLDPKTATPERTVIRTYLIWRITSMRESNKLSRTILYSTIFKRIEQAKGKELTPKMKRNTKDVIIEFLDEFKKWNFIDSYKESGTGRYREKIDIYL